MTQRRPTIETARSGARRRAVVGALLASSLLCAGALAGREDKKNAPTPARSQGQPGVLQVGAAPGSLDLQWMIGADAGDDRALATPANACANAPFINGPGVFPFDFTGATTDGPAHAGCAGSGGGTQTYNDLWWRWQATASGFVNLRTCALTAADTRINVYHEGACPPTDAQLIGCNDNSCGVQSEVSFYAVAGQVYVLRLGTSASAPSTATGGLMIEMNTAPADDCVNATLISGAGLFAFDNSVANTDGPAEPSCGAGINGQIQRDVWWRWSASSTGPVILTTNGLTAVQTRIAVYEPGAACPPGASSKISTSISGACSGASDQMFNAVAGQEYLIRLGAAPNAVGGSGHLRITLSNPFLCVLDVCQNLMVAPAYYSNPIDYRVAEDWVAPTTGAISSICFWGAYNLVNPAVPPPDNFRITYYYDRSGRPGLTLATFTGAQLSVVSRLDMGSKIDGIYNIFEYSACHAPVPVQDGQRYWIEISNGLGASIWAWCVSPDGDHSAFQDNTPADFTYANAVPILKDFAMCVGLDTTCPYDTNKDGVINFADLNNIIPLLNTACP